MSGGWGKGTSALGALLLTVLSYHAALAGPATIVAFGDSTTAPRGRTEVFATLLGNELSFDGSAVRVVNAGVGGNTTAQASARFAKDVLAHQPDVVILQFGINDAAVDAWKTPPATAPRVALADYRKNLSAMVQTLKQRGARVVLMSPNATYWSDTTRKLYGKPPYLPDDADGFNVMLRDYAEAVRDIARREGVALVDVFDAFKKADQQPGRKPGWLCRDGMHPDDDGHRLVANLLIDCLIAADSRFARQPNTAWTPSGDANQLNPYATDITHDAPGPAVLGPALVKLPDSAVMSVYSTPTSYAGKPGECYIAGRITRDGGRSWEPERELTRLPDGRAAHPTVLRTHDGSIHIFFLGYQQHAWNKQEGNPTTETRSDLWTVRSGDGGQTWTAPRVIFDGYTGSTNGAVEAHDGHLVVPFSHYVANPGRLVSRTVVSKDGGETWKQSNALDIGGAGDHEGALEPCVIELRDQRLWMLIRTSRKFFWESFSTDGGLTWSEAKPTSIDSSHSPGHVIRLSDGRLALAWNPAEEQRRQLHLALSDDEGRTWTSSLIAVRGSATYPYLLEAKPGELWVGYMDCHNGWGTTPRARHLKIAEQVILDHAKAMPAQKPLSDITRQPDAYNTWKFALTPGTATDPTTFTVPAGFTVELLRSAAPEEDSWVSIAFDPQGRLTIAREKKGLLRMTLSAGAGVEKVESINDTLLECRGLLYAHGALYANANNSKVLVRLRDTDGDDQFDQADELLRTEGGVGHGRNHVKLGPDGMLYVVHGNNVVAPPDAAPDSPLRHFQDDRLIPCPWDPQMFDGDVKLPAGHILRGDPDGKSWTLLAGGLRNPLDVAFNPDGEMFTFDADMEWDTGTPWYRPCRVNHVISGAEFGWRRGTSKWPAYFPDCGPTVIEIGLASPTGIEFGTRSHFPPSWQRALFISDWSYGRIIAVHLQARGASYTATAENFIVGKPLNVTDVAFGPDGAMYFITGGRRTQSGLYRVSYTGPRIDELVAPVDAAAAQARALRRSLEALHGHPQAGAVEKIWPHLSSADPAIRHAARIALEWQDVKTWQARALNETGITASLTALMALASCAPSEMQRPMLEKLNALDFDALSEEQQILAARDYQLALIRLGPLDPGFASLLTAHLDGLYPAKHWPVTHLLCELLAHLRAPAFRDKTFALLANAKRSEDLLHYLFHLRLVPDGWTPDQRRAYFTALNHAETLEGARDYQRSLKMLRAEVLDQLTPAEHEAIAPLLAAAAPNRAPASSGPQVIVREWTMEDLAPALDRVGRGRSFDAGKQAFAGAQCVLCHRMGPAGGLVGPDLTAVSSRFNRRDLLDSIINPSRVIDEKFRNTTFNLKSGASVIGTIEAETEESVTLRLHPLTPGTTTINQSAVRSREPSPLSPMPPGLLNVLTQNQILDLLAYLESGGDPKHPDFTKDGHLPAGR